MSVIDTPGDNDCVLDRLARQHRSKLRKNHKRGIKRLIGRCMPGDAVTVNLKRGKTVRILKSY